jgi:hypothetical protein
MENVNYDTRPKSVLSLGKYQARKSLPVMENPEPDDYKDAVNKVNYIVPGTDFNIIGNNYIEKLRRAYKNRDKKGNPIGKWLYRDAQKRWYRVKAVFAGRVIDGYINELALLGKSIKKY